MTLHDEIAKLVLTFGLQMLNGVVMEENIADQILALLAPELEKARKWDRVKEIAEFGCYVCPFVDSHCPIDECKPSTIIKAIEDAEGRKDD